MKIVAMLASMIFLMGIRPIPEGIPCVEQEVDRREATIGDRIEFTVRVFTEKGQQVIVPEKGGALSNFIVKQRYQHEKQREGITITTIMYELVHYDVGWDTIPPITIIVRTGKKSTALVTKAEVIEIKSIAPGMTGKEDIRPLRQQIGMKIPVWQYMTLLGIFGCLVTAVLFLIWRKRRARVPEEAPSRPPWEVALEALERLSQKEADAPEEIKKFYTELSYILRNYYEERFLFPAREHTTTEIMKRLRSIAALKPYVKKTGDLLKKSDLVKFAKYLPASPASGAEIDLVKEIVAFTIEKEEEEEVAHV